MATLRKQLEENQRLRDQAEKTRAKAEKAKEEAKRVRDGAEQRGYNVGVAEIEDALRAEVLAVCQAYYAQTWEEALNRAGIDASSELRRLENIFFPQAIQALGSASGQKETAPSVTKSLEDAQLQNPPTSNQQEQTKELEVSQGTSLDRVVEAPQSGAASQSFEKELALTTLLVGGASKEKEKEIPPVSTDKASKSKLQIKFKPYFFFFLRIMSVDVILFF